MPHGRDLISSLEEPTVAIDLKDADLSLDSMKARSVTYLFLILLLHAKNDLNRHKPGISSFDLALATYRNCSQLSEMSLETNV